MDLANLDQCQELPAASAILGLGEGVDVDGAVFFVVLPYEVPVTDRGLAERMDNMCRFHEAA